MTLNVHSKYIVHKQITLKTGQTDDYHIFDLHQVAKIYGFSLEHLPYALRILLENVVMHGQEQQIQYFADWLKTRSSKNEIDYRPARVLMQDFTGVPAIVDLASMRQAAKNIGKDPMRINPIIPVDLVIDHSLQLDKYATDDALEYNTNSEMRRNLERYEFLKWGQQSFDNFRLVPPGTGICHQVNLEYLASVVFTKEIAGRKYAFADTLVGTDSHTTMVNGLSVLGWGVGGIEAEAAMLGQSIPMLLPEVVGVRLVGSLKAPANATDLVLTITNMLRKKGVVGKCVEFFGEALAQLSLADRATIANMAPEYGATCGFFPIDHETLKYLKLTARGDDLVHLVEEYAKWQGAFYDPQYEPLYSEVIECDLSAIETTISGPKRPQDTLSLAQLPASFPLPLGTRSKEQDESIGEGSIVIAAITSCTNTSNPYNMIAAALVAKKAYEFGLKPKEWVKTSFAPGSQVVTEYLKKAGLMQYMDAIGFNVVGYGCTTCIGNSGPLLPKIEEEIKARNLLVASVLSGNRNFEGRIHALVKANYLASGPLVILYALAGHVNLDLGHDYIAIDDEGRQYFLADLWPAHQEILEYIAKYITADIFAEKYQSVFAGNKMWQEIKCSPSQVYDWKASSTYIKNPPYFEHMYVSKGRAASPAASPQMQDISDARILCLFGDSITTDHISPAGSIKPDSPAARYLLACNVAASDFNSYGSRRGNHEVMMRGTFANSRIRNHLLTDGSEGGSTINYLTGEKVSIYDAAMDYQKNNIPLVIFAGKEYGSGSSRDWAAKGTKLLGVRAIIAQSFERIHRSNLVGMGVLPLLLPEGCSWQSLKLDGSEVISLLGIEDYLRHKKGDIMCRVTKQGGNSQAQELVINLRAALYTQQEIEYLLSGCILNTVLQELFS
jgi:aconitate hydratase